ncbi:MAG: hypothetical protein AAGU11_03115 [Syntrophobacteraceae bacterium]
MRLGRKKPSSRHLLLSEKTARLLIESREQLSLSAVGTVLCAHLAQLFIQATHEQGSGDNSRGAGQTGCGSEPERLSYMESGGEAAASGTDQEIRRHKRLSSPVITGPPFSSVAF